jgi:NO-binding membrane sensor protein with MHYT domain
VDIISLLTGIAIGAGIASLFWIGVALYAMHPTREWIAPTDVETAHDTARSA